MTGPSFDLASDDFWADPAAALSKMRSECPVGHGSGGFVALLRHDDILAALRDTETWSSAAGPGLSNERDDAPVNILVNSDPPRHSAERKVVSGWFRPSVISELEPTISASVASLLDDFAPLGRGDLMADVVNPLPLQVVSEMVGLTEPDLVQLRRWVVALSESVTYTREQMPLRVVEASREFTAFCREQITLRRRRAAGGHKQDMLESLLTAEVQGEHLTDRQIVSFMQFILVAGTGTTSLLIGNLVARLLEHPEQLALVRERPELIEPAVEESLRFDAPAVGLFRTPTEDVSIGGVEIAAETKTMMMFASANRDPAAWDDPDRFDVTRDLGMLKRHAAFGFGTHFCLGAPLARLEARVVLGQVLERLPGLRIDGTPIQVPSSALNGFESFPVAWNSVTALG